LSDSTSTKCQHLSDWTSAARHDDNRTLAIRLFVTATERSQGVDKNPVTGLSTRRTPIRISDQSRRLQAVAGGIGTIAAAAAPVAGLDICICVPTGRQNRLR